MQAAGPARCQCQMTTRLCSLAASGPPAPAQVEAYRARLRSSTVQVACSLPNGSRKTYERVLRYPTGEVSPRHQRAPLFLSKRYVLRQYMADYLSAPICMSIISELLRFGLLQVRRIRYPRVEDDLGSAVRQESAPRNQQWDRRRADAAQASASTQSHTADPLTQVTFNVLLQASLHTTLKAVRIQPTMPLSARPSHYWSLLFACLCCATVPRHGQAAGLHTCLLCSGVEPAPLAQNQVSQLHSTPSTSCVWQGSAMQLICPRPARVWGLSSTSCTAGHF